MINIKKRDGSIVNFEVDKVYNSVFKASNAIYKNIENSKFIADNVKFKIMDFITNKQNATICIDTEEVQNIIQKILVKSGYVQVAEEYIKYRIKRTKQRDSKSKLIQSIKEITFSNAADSNLKRDNGNVNGDTPMGMMLQYGSTVAKQFADDYLIGVDIEKHIKAGDIYVHDKDFLPSGTLTCCQISLDKLFKGGFNTGHGYIREPQSIRSYASLAAIAIQSNQNDMHGGQSIPLFDYYLAPGVTKTLKKELKYAFKILMVAFEKNNIEDILEACFQIIDETDFKIASKDKSLLKIKEKLSKYLNVRDCEKVVEAAYEIAIKTTEQETYQAMESFIHNLNTMHCLPFSEKIWVYDKQDQVLRLQKIGELNDIYADDRFYAISLNKKTYETEFKKITAIKRLNNNRKLVRLKTKAGQQVTVTDNHEILTYDNNRKEIVDVLPMKIKQILTPINFYHSITTIQSAINEESIFEIISSMKQDDSSIIDSFENLKKLKEKDSYIKVTYNDEEIASQVQLLYLSLGKFVEIEKDVQENKTEYILKIYESSTLKSSKQKKSSNRDRTSLTIIDVESKEELNSEEEYVFDISVEDNENFLTKDCIFVHNSRAGAQVPFSSINFGMDISEEGRMISRNLLKAQEAGLGNGETPIFPILIFQVKEGVNYNPNDPNYDLFKLSIQVSAKRLFPNFVFVDAPFNLCYYDPSDPETIISTMGCRTRVIGNINGKQTPVGRGNLSFTTINLPRLGIKYGIMYRNKCESAKDNYFDKKGFYQELDYLIEICIKQLLERYEIQRSRYVRNFPFLMGQGIWRESDSLNLDSEIGDVINSGTLSIGFIGLAECLIALTGYHHGEDERLQKFGLEIIGFMREKMDIAIEKYKLNFSLLATPAEGLSGFFTKLDKEKYGIIEGVTDKEYYTNSFHVPVSYDISFFNKIKIEAPYHALTNAGHITYVEIDGDLCKNLTAFETIIRCMKEAGIGYGSVNHPIDRDPVCGYSGVIDGDICPNCGRDISKVDKREEIIKRL